MLVIFENDDMFLYSIHILYMNGSSELFKWKQILRNLNKSIYIKYLVSCKPKEMIAVFGPVEMGTSDSNGSQSRWSKAYIGKLGLKPKEIRYFFPNSSRFAD